MNIESQEIQSVAVRFVAKEDGKEVGWARLFIIENDFHDEPYGEFEYVRVNEEYRGRGIGTALVKKVIQEAKDRGCYKLLAQSRYSRPHVHELYKKYGFKDWGKNFRMDLIESEAKEPE